MRRIPFVFLLVATGSAQAAGEFYCCHEPSTGRQICADTLPIQCRGNAYRVLDSGGNLIKEVGPPLTPDQKAQLAIELRQKKQLEEAGREQRRRDQALLDTYTTAEDIDLAQQKAEADVNFAIQATLARIDVASKKRQRYANEAEFYKKKTMPADLARQLQALDHEIKLQQELLELKKHDFETIRTKYDADRKRYFELTRRPPAAPTGKAGR